MPRFLSAKEAFEWALEYAEVRGGIKAANYDPDKIRSPGYSLDYA